MAIRLVTWTVALAALAATGAEVTPRVDVLHGHPIYHPHEREAGVAMGLSISVDDEHADTLTEPCEHLRTAARLEHEDAF